MTASPQLKLAVLFGGISEEHEVSLRSAAAVVEHLDPDRFEVVLQGIDRQGGWLDEEDSRRLFEGQTPLGSGGPPFLQDGVECVFPVLHGPGGEDGTVQGWLELMEAPYVGSDCIGSAVAMDKSLAKHVLRSAGLPVVDWLDLAKVDFRNRRAEVLAEIAAWQPFPLFVKPARLGSSVGISRVMEAAQLGEALDQAFEVDDHLLIEPALEVRELEIAVLDGPELLVSPPGEIRPKEWYDYSAKYLDDTAELFVPAPNLAPRRVEMLQEMAAQAFRALRLGGMARVDFFLMAKDGRPYLNEINTIPGFTSISMYPKLMALTGLDFQALCSRLIDLALARQVVRVPG
ncbi:MAG: D-alanine--D-alanine ligase [Planctomycetota bacterium]|nr:MAG: D-alanine--D-alanine ligase [Planctomycetota bacterium]